ncbi:MAG: MFS transporter [Cyanobacteria bacterium P01_H01_bin.15]
MDFSLSNRFEQQLNASPLTRNMWLLWALSAGLIMLDGFDFFIIGVALPFLKQDFQLSAAAIGLTAVAAIAGSLFGSLTLGPVTDRIGRQKMLVIDVVIFVLATAGTALAWNVEALVLFRFVVGVGIGADYPISVSYITENIPARRRGQMVIGAFAFQAVGALLGAITGVVVIKAFSTMTGGELLAIQYAWRIMLGIGGGLALGVAALRLGFTLESPSYHIARQEYELASETASFLLAKEITITAESDPPPETEATNYGSLFSAPYRSRTLLASVPWFLQDIATYGVGIFTPTIISAIAFSGKDSFLARETAAAQGAALVDCFLIFGFLLAIWLVERWGRVRLQISGFVGMAIGLAVLAYASTQNAETTWGLSLVFIGFIVFNLSMNAGPNATTFLLSGEVFPPVIRASGAGLAAAIAKLGAVAGTFGLPLLQSQLGDTWVLSLLPVVCLLAAGITWQYRTSAKDLIQTPVQAIALNTSELT